jgi:hypothetical protein
MMHAAHNGLQAAVGPAAQIVTVFLPLSLLYALARSARRGISDGEHAPPLSISAPAP